MTNDSDTDKHFIVSVHLCSELPQCLIVYHTLLIANLAHYSPARALADIKKQASACEGLSMTLCHNVPPLGHTGRLGTVLWLPVL